MVQTVYDNLKPGQLFVASHNNPQLPPQPFIDHGKYGVTTRLLDAPLHEGATIHVNTCLVTQTAMVQNARYIARELIARPLL
jgi:hypothetical protein